MFEILKNIFAKKQIQPLGTISTVKLEPKIKQIKRGFPYKSEQKSNK